MISSGSMEEKEWWEFEDDISEDQSESARVLVMTSVRVAQVLAMTWWSRGSSVPSPCVGG